MEKLGHNSPVVTKRYIGITDDEIEDVEGYFSQSHVGMQDPVPKQSQNRHWLLLKVISITFALKRGGHRQGN